MMTTTTTMECPFCHAGCWDNRGRELNEHSPQYRCRNGNCRAAGWEGPEGVRFLEGREEDLRPDSRRSIVVTVDRTVALEAMIAQLSAQVAQLLQAKGRK